MNRQQVVGLAALAIIAAGGIVALGPGDVADAAGVEGVEHPEMSRLALLPDSGKGYTYPVDLADGGTAWLLTDVGPCVRRPADASVDACMRRGSDGGAFDFGPLNRFPRAEAVGDGCQGVACSVTAGEDANASEDDILDIVRDGGQPWTL